MTSLKSSILALLGCACLAAHADQPEANTIAAHDSSDGLALTPPMGWYPWNQFGDAQDEDLIKSIADAMVKTGMRDAGYGFVGPDEGVCFDRAADGRLTPVLKRYPSGLRGLGDYIHSLGLKYALYTDAGTRTCSKGMPGTKGHESDDMRTLADWRCDYVKIDWCNAEGMNEAVSYQRLYQAQRATGRPIMHSVCSWGDGKPWTGWGAASSHLWRTTSDVCAPGKVDWNNAIKIALFNQGLYQNAGPGYWNDPDMLIVGMQDMTDARDRTIFSLWCLMASPLIAGNNVCSMTPATLAILTNLEAIGVNQDPLGIQGHLIHDSNGISVWAAKRLFDGSQAVVLCNRQSAPAEVRVSRADLGLDESAAFFMRNLWQHETTGPLQNDISLTVPAGDVVMLRIATANDFPIPPIISADTYRLSFRASGAAPQTLTANLVAKTVGTDVLPLWKVRANLPPWLTVKVTQNGKSQTFANTVNTAGLKMGAYHAIVRADNTEPRSNKPMSALYYDVDLEIPASASQKQP